MLQKSNFSVLCFTLLIFIVQTYMYMYAQTVMIDFIMTIDVINIAIFDMSHVFVCEFL